LVVVWVAGGIEFRGGPWDGWKLPIDPDLKKLVFVHHAPDQGIRTLYHYEKKVQEHVPRMVLQYTEDEKIPKKRKKK
jgi:hypothetical protein